MLALQLAIAGVAAGSVYALIALGIVLIYKCSGVVNFAQGAYAMLGAYITYFFLRMGFPSIVSVLAGMALMALAGGLFSGACSRRRLCQ